HKGRSLGKSLAPRLGVKKRDINKVHRLLQEWIDTYEAAIDVPVITDIPLQEVWESSGDLGTENFAKYTPKDLHKLLGADIPFLFAPFYDLQERDHQEAGPSEVNITTFEEGKNKRRELMWHQLTGLCAIICHFFKSSSEGEVGVDLGLYPGQLVCDAVGLGKTFMMFSVICTVAEEFERQKGDEKNGGVDHPPIFENRTVFCGNPAKKIPDLPWIIVLPTSIIGQWSKQLKSCMKRAAFDILIYPTKAVDWPLWMTEVFGKSHYPPIRRIVLMSDKTLSRQSRMALDTKGLDPLTRQVPVLKSISATVLKGCVFSHQWNGAFVDEIHMSFRTGGVAYWGLVALWNQAYMKVGATATPLQEGPMDLMYIGRALALPAFRDPNMDDKFKMLQKQTQSLKTIATKHGDDPTALYITHSGSSNDEEIDDDIRQYQAMNKIFAQTMQSAFLPYVIRRTRDSLDWEGKKVLDKLSPAEEHVIHIRLPDAELQHIQEDLEVLKKNGERQKQTRMFHLNQRMGLNDPRGAASLVTKSPLKNGKKSKMKGRCTKFGDLNDWNTDKGTKLDTVISTILWKFSNVEHKEPPLMADGSIDLGAVKEGILPTENWMEEKAIVFHSFASETTLFKSALKVHGVQTWALNGEISAKDREVILDEFKTYEGAAVLLVTHVGCTGINMAFVRFIFLVDVSWSKQQDEQTIGRADRPGQTGKVIVYRFLCLGTSDLLMGAGAGVKSDLLREFFKKDNCQELYKEIFHIEESNADIQDETVDSDEEARPVSIAGDMETRKGKGRQRELKLTSAARGGAKDLGETPDPPTEEARDLQEEEKLKRKAPNSAPGNDEDQVKLDAGKGRKKKKPIPSDMGDVGSSSTNGEKKRKEREEVHDLQAPAVAKGKGKEATRKRKVIAHRKPSSEDDLPCAPSKVAQSHEKQDHGSNVQRRPEEGKRHPPTVQAKEDAPQTRSDDVIELHDSDVETSKNPPPTTLGLDGDGGSLEYLDAMLDDEVDNSLHPVNSTIPNPRFVDNTALDLFNSDAEDDAPSKSPYHPAQLRLTALETALSHPNHVGEGDPPQADIMLSSPGDGWTHKPTEKYQQLQAKVRDKAGKTGQGSRNSAAADSADAVRGVKRKVDELKEMEAPSNKLIGRSCHNKEPTSDTVGKEKMNRQDCQNKDLLDQDLCKHPRAAQHIKL
ncbi:hypothetical protein F5146DRAFT_1145717, partial [Armillaria mellea]